MMKLTFFQRVSISAAVRQEWYLALAKVAGDGLPIFEALDKMSAVFSKTGHPLAPLVRIVLLRLRGAGAAKASVQRRTLGSELKGMVPDDEAMLIQAGDTAGRIEHGLRNAAKLVATKGTLNASVIGALRKPGGYLFGLLGLMVFMAVKIMPQFEKSRPRAMWPEQAQLLGTVADHVFLISGGVVMGVVLIVVSLKYAAPNWTGELREKFDRRVFPFNVMAAMSGASFLTSLSGFIGAGTSFADAIKSMQGTATPYIREQCGKVLDSMKRGRRPEEALCELPIIPQRFHWIIDVYAMSGDSEKAFLTIAEEMVLRVQILVTRLFSYVLGNLLMFVVVYMLFWIYKSMSDIALSGSQL